MFKIVFIFILAVSLQDMVRDLDKTKSLLEIGDTSPFSSNDTNKDQQENSNSSGTFETAHGSSANTISEDIKINDTTDSPNLNSSNNNHRETVDSDYIDVEDTVVHSSADQSSNDKAAELVKGSQPQTNGEPETEQNIAVSEVFESSEHDTDLQSKILTKEKPTQTNPLVSLDIVH